MTRTENSREKVNPEKQKKKKRKVNFFGVEMVIFSSLNDKGYKEVTLSLAKKKENPTSSDKQKCKKTVADTSLLAAGTDLDQSLIEQIPIKTKNLF